MKLVSWILFFSFVFVGTSAKHDAYRYPEGACGEQAGGALCRDGYCCSKWGWCGNTEAYCSPDQCQSQCPSPPPPPILPPAGACGDQAGGALCPDGYCCSKWGWCGITEDYCSPDQCQSQCPSPSPPPSPVVPTPPPPPSPTPSGDDVSSIITSSLFDKLLPYRNDPRCDGAHIGFYSYNAFLAAARSFAGFGTTGDVDTRKREIAAFLAQTSHETTGGAATIPTRPFAWAYCYITQINKLDYCMPSAEWPCVSGKQYYGRGAIQLSWNYNYGQAGEALGYDLLNNPDLVATDPVLSFKIAIWFWMTAQGNKPSSHDVIIGKWVPSAADISAGRVPGYGVITNIINGGLECGHGYDLRVANRIGFYTTYCDEFGISYGDNLDCYNQRPFAYGAAIHMPAKYLRNHTM